MDEELLPVYIIRDYHYQDRLETVMSLFSPQTFTVLVPAIFPDIGAKKISFPKDHSQSSYNQSESYQVAWCLRDAKTRFPSRPVLIVKDSTICIASPQTIADIVTATLKSSKNHFHLCYLCRWMDKCQLYSNKIPIANSTASIVKTQSPHGIQAILFTPQGRDIVLGQSPMNNGQQFHARESLSATFHREIVAGNLTALCIVPNLMEYDIHLASRDTDYIKSNPCAPIPALHDSPNTINIYVSFIIVVILLLFLVWAAAYVAP